MTYSSVTYVKEIQEDKGIPDASLGPIIYSVS